METKQKILVCGDVKGKFKTLFSRVESVNKKSGPFDMLLCVGDFFGHDPKELLPYKNGLKKVPLATYILGPASRDQEEYYSDITGCEICPDINYLGKRGLYTSSGGLKIAYLSGYSETTEETSEAYNFNETDVLALRDACLRGQHSFRGVDILVTSIWPKNITNLDDSTVSMRYKGSQIISWLAVHLKPRYHFSANEGIYFERKPYRNPNKPGEAMELATRFIALANVGNEKKYKWLYAMSLNPVDTMRMTELYQQTTDETDCPFPLSLVGQSLGKTKEENNGQFFYDMSAQREDTNFKRKRKGAFDQEKRQKPTFDQAKCWFCLASPQVEKHLIISIGEHAYLALAKGGLVSDHLLILPITHLQSTNGLPAETVIEIGKFKNALKECFSMQDKVPVFFERNFKTSHLQIQVVPIPKGATREIKEIFQDEAQGYGLTLNELPEDKTIEDVVPQGSPFFLVELPNGPVLYTRVKSDFPIQFGREILASGPILNMAERVDWRDCKQNQSEETAMAKKFRMNFQPYDFTLAV